MNTSHMELPFVMNNPKNVAAIDLHALELSGYLGVKNVTVITLSWWGNGILISGAGT